MTYSGALGTGSLGSFVLGSEFVQTLPVVIPPVPEPWVAGQRWSPAFAAAVRGSHARTARLVMLTSALTDDVILEGSTSILIDGTVTIDRTRQQRRSMTITVANAGGAWTPIGPGSAIYPGHMVRIDRGLVLADGSTEWMPLGVFVIEDPEMAVTAGGSTIGLAGTDRTRLAASSGFGAPFTLPAGTRVRDAVRTLAQDAGMGTQDDWYDLDDGSAALGADVTWEADDGRLDAMMRLASDHALELYCSATGVLTLRPIVAIEDVAAVWTFARGADAIMLGVTRKLSDAGAFNHVIVVGEGADVGPFRGEARDLNPASPLYNPADGSGPAGDRLAPIHRSALITSAGQAQAVAERMLREVALIEEQLSIPSAPHPGLEAGDVVDVREPVSGVADRYRLDQVVQPVGAGRMQISAARIRSFAPSPAPSVPILPFPITYPESADWIDRTWFEELSQPDATP